MSGLRSYDVTITSGRRQLVDITGFPLHEGMITFLLGESGIGKSMIARALYGLHDPGELDVRVNGHPYTAYLRSPEVRRFRQNGFFVFQEPSTHLNPVQTIADQLTEGDLGHTPTSDDILRQLWDDSGNGTYHALLPVFPKPFRPSGGEKQRILCTMALRKLDLLLARGEGPAGGLFVFDEPTGSLDDRFRNAFVSLLFERYRRAPFTTLFITHDYSLLTEITRKHSSLLPFMHFRELAREGGRLTVREFQPSAYTGWLDAVNPVKPVGASQTLLQAENRMQVFGRELRIVRDGDTTGLEPFRVGRGELAYVKAPSGTGKTTMMKALMGLIQPERMTLSLAGTTLHARTPRSVWREQVWGKKMAMVFQHADEALNPQATVAETFRGLPGGTWERSEVLRPLLTLAFDDATVSSILHRKTSRLSGGQRQRLNVLRGISLETDIVILDEPLNGLDFGSFRSVVGLLRKRCDDGCGIIVISHNEEIFDRLVSPGRRYRLYAG